MRNGARVLVVGSLAVALAVSAPAVAEKAAPGGFTGEIKPVIYVSEVRRAAAFYRDVLGFGFQGFAGDEADPYYAELLAGDVKFGLHEPTRPSDRERVGQTRLYFRVRDLAAERLRIESLGAEPGEVVRTSWMDFFAVRDPDGNEIVLAVTDPQRHASQPWRRERGDSSGGEPDVPPRRGGSR